MNLTISCHALDGITTPQTIKIEGHIKKKMVIVLIDSGSTHNFIHCKIAKEFHFLLYLALECKVMVENGGLVNFSGKCHNIKLSMGEYVLNIPILFILMGVVDVVLGVQQLQSLGKMGKIIISNGMEKILNKEKRDAIAQLCSLEVPTSKSSISPDLQKVLDNHSKVFETPKGLPPIHDHAVYLILGSVPPNIRP
eukprot:PITA_27082